MKKKIAVLFDLDGVIIDTESQYNSFWSEIGEKYNVKIKNFGRLVQGTRVPDTITKYFSHLSDKEQREIENQNYIFYTQMKIDPIPGVLDFIYELKNTDVPIGLVTSSNNEKLASLFQKLYIKHLFDTIVSADRISIGKPNPMCYLQAARDLNINPKNCVVFEDSYNGIKAGNDAGMLVIGLSTTLSIESIKDDCSKVIPNFLNFNFQFLNDLISLERNLN
ncbi:MAG: HAD family phosphatase [Bacteroidales bacterium OttesenSCG-928-I14]|jgi:HAD superfamily hydrolase (TIGR01509 family)|nr:HAD family phosphatase [Bacteroidales bacterium OttesenSCG-928-I14]